MVGDNESDIDGLSRYTASAPLSARATTHAYLQSRFQVGSVKSQKISYALGQKVFHSTDVPPEALAAKRSVQKTKQSNTLGTEQPAWNASTIADQKVQRDPLDLKRQLLKVRAGLFDETVVKPSRGHSDESIADLQRHIVAITGRGPIGKCTTEWFNAVDERGLGSHCDREAWPDWNASTSCHTKDDIKQAQGRFEEADARKRRMHAKAPLLRKETYIDPASHIANVGERLRERKIAFQDLKDQFKRELKVEFPQASEERLQAMAQRLLSEKMLVDEKMARFPVHHESFRPNITVTTQNRRYREYHHPGTWTWLEADGCYGWSCCSNFGQDSRGCESRIVNPDRWCTHGFEHHS